MCALGPTQTGIKAQSLSSFLGDDLPADTQVVHVTHAANVPAGMSYNHNQRGCIVRVGGEYTFFVITRERDGVALHFRTIADRPD